MNQRLVFLLISVFLLGCGPKKRADGEFERRLVDVTGESHLIAFHVEGSPVDTLDGTVDTLTLPEAVRRTLIGDPRIQAALARVRAAEADVRQTKLLPNPVFDVALRFPQGGGKTVIDASLTADLLALLQRPRRISAADHKLRAASEEALVAVLDALAEVQEHYVAVQALDAQIEVSKERRALMTRLLDVAKNKLQAGEGTRLEAAALDAQRIGLEAEIADRLLGRTDERIVLTRLIGQPSGDARWAVTAWTSPEIPAATEQAWVAAAMLNRPEVQAGRWELAALGDEAALAALTLFDGASVGGASEREDRWTAGPSLSAPLPLFDWGQAKRAKARAEQIEARHKLTLAQREAVEEVRRAYATLVASHQAVEQAKGELIPLQQQRRDEAEASYQIGETDVTVLMLAEQDLREAKERLIGLQQKASTAWFRLQRAVGGPGVAARVEGNASGATSRPSTTTASP